MTAPRRGDIVLVGFVFSDESGTKLRGMIERRLGSLTTADLVAVSRKLRHSLGL